MRPSGRAKDRLVRVLLFVFQEDRSGRFAGDAKLFGDLPGDLMPGQGRLGGQAAGLPKDLLSLSVGQTPESAGSTDQVRILPGEFLDGRLDEAQAMRAVVEDELAGQQAAGPPAIDRLRGDLELCG